jgi:hypothetical protein
MFRKNEGRYLIKTPTGYKNFEGVQKKIVDSLYTINFEDGSFIKCSGNHAFLTDNGLLKANELTEKNILTGKKIQNISSEFGAYEVFDPVGVEEHSTYFSNDVVSHNTEFVGSSHTLISGAKLKTLVFNNPIRQDGRFDIIEEPQTGHTYVITVDVSRGQGLDYSAFSIIDVTSIPYKQVAKYRDKDISPLLYPTIIFNAATAYNNAYVLVEINDIGQQISDILHHELEYENLVKIQIKPRQGQQMSFGHTKKIQFGVKTSVTTKRIGCSNLKTLIESDKLLIMDSDTIMELMTFVATRESFAAEEGSHDDLAMTLVLFAWFIAQRNFRESLNGDIRTVLQKEQLNISQDDLVPFGIIDDGINDRNMEIADIERQWVEERKLKAPLDSYDYDWRGRF